MDATVETTEALERKDEEQQAELAELRTEFGNLRAELADLRAELKILRGESAEHRAEIAECRRRINEQNEELAARRTMDATLDPGSPWQSPQSQTQDTKPQPQDVQQPPLPTRWAHGGFGPGSSWQSPRSRTPEPPPPDTKPPPPPYPLPTQVPPQALGRTGAYHHRRHFDVGEHARWIDVFIPCDYAHIPEGELGELPAVLYLPTTFCESPPIAKFGGRMVVYAPKFTNQSKKPNRNPMPPWVRDWIATKQNGQQRWSLFGCSRGAAWGAQLASISTLKFVQVFLVAPYTFAWAEEKQNDDMVKGLKKYGQNLTIAFGSKEYLAKSTWTNDVFDNCHGVTWEGLTHEESIKRAVDEWGGLF